MKKVLTVILGISVLVFSLSIAYYFGLFLPQKETEKLELSKQKFIYQIEKDTMETKEKQSEKIGDSILPAQKETEEAIKEAQDECEKISEKKPQSYEELLESSKKKMECINNITNNLR